MKAYALTDSRLYWLAGCCPKTMQEMRRVLDVTCCKLFSGAVLTLPPHLVLEAAGYSVLLAVLMPHWYVLPAEPNQS